MTALLSMLSTPTTAPAGSQGKVAGQVAPGAGATPAASGELNIAQFISLLGQQGGGSQPSAAVPGAGDALAGLRGKLTALGGAFVETGGNLQLRSDLASDLDAFEVAVLSFLQGQSGPEGAATSSEGANLVASGEGGMPGQGGELSPELLDIIGDVLGTHVAAFDAQHGTNFTARLEGAMANLAAATQAAASQAAASQASDPKQVSLKAGQPQAATTIAAAPLVSEVVSRVARILGVERSLTNSQPTATQTLMMFQPGVEPAALSSVAPRADLPSLKAGWSMQAEFSDVANAAVAKAAQSAGGAKSILEQIASAGQAPGSQPTSAGMAAAAPLPGGLPAGMTGQPLDLQRLDMVATLHHSHADSGEIARFDDALSHAAKARADHVGQQSVQPRFANLVLSQMKNASFNENRMRIELAPRGLGEISISVETDASGRVQALIRVENPQVLEMLRNDRSQLEDLLSDKGFDLSGGSLDFEEFEHDEADGEAGHGAAGDIDELPEDETEATEAVSVIGNDHLDILT